MRFLGHFSIRRADVAKRSKLEVEMLRQLKAAGLDTGMCEEHTFHDTRKWRFDFCWPHLMVALEVQGGIYSRGRHARPRGMLNDMEKASESAILGWRLLLVTGVEISNGHALDRVERALAGNQKSCTSCGRRKR